MMIEYVDKIVDMRRHLVQEEALARDRRIGMIQPYRPGDDSPLYAVGCLGRIEDVEALEDGRYNLVLEGKSRFRLIRELDVTTPFRQVEAELMAESEDNSFGIADRASLERESRKFADSQGYAVDWEAVTRLDDEALVNGIAQIAPFDSAAKQALLEAPKLTERADLLIQLLRFYREQGDGEEKVTLQ